MAKLGFCWPFCFAGAGRESTVVGTTSVRGLLVEYSAAVHRPLIGVAYQGALIRYFGGDVQVLEKWK